MPDSKPVRSITLMGLLAVTATTALAADDQHRCASIPEDPTRLACYDAAFGKPVTALQSMTPAAAAAAPGGAAPATGRSAATAAAESIPATPSPASRAREEFGLSEVEKRARAPEKDVEPASISGVVAKVGRRPTGEMVLSLADGQVWTQVESDGRSRVKTGDTVTIRKATLGSYLLVGPDRIAIRVRRVK